MAVASALCLLVFVAVVVRLAVLQPTGESIACHAKHFVWTLAHVLLGVGAIALLLNYLAGKGDSLIGTLLIQAGVAMLLVIPWRRRSADRHAH